MIKDNFNTGATIENLNNFTGNQPAGSAYYRYMAPTAEGTNVCLGAAFSRVAPFLS
jgi:hypothetical protein